MTTPGPVLTGPSQGGGGVELLSVGLLSALLHVGPQHQLRPVPLGPGGGQGAARGAAGVVGARHGGGDGVGLVCQGLLGGEVGFVNKQKVGNVRAGFGPLPLGVPLQRVRDGPRDLLSGGQISAKIYDISEWKIMRECLT